MTNQTQRGAVELQELKQRSAARCERFQEAVHQDWHDCTEAEVDADRAVAIADSAINDAQQHRDPKVRTVQILLDALGEDGPFAMRLSRREQAEHLHDVLDLLERRNEISHD